MPETEAKIEVELKVAPLAARRSAIPFKHSDPDTGMLLTVGEALDEDRAVLRDTKYIREEYPDDHVLQTYADMIEQNIAIWEGIKRLMSAGVDLSNYELHDWRSTFEHEPNGMLSGAVEFGLINKKEGVGGRPK